jgi:hypothetical protein
MQEIMTTKFPIREAAHFLTDPEGVAIRRLDAEPNEEHLLADAEEEEFTELWAHDPGNQGA